MICALSAVNGNSIACSIIYHNRVCLINLHALRNRRYMSGWKLLDQTFIKLESSLPWQVVKRQSMLTICREIVPGTADCTRPPPLKLQHPGSKTRVSQLPSKKKVSNAFNKFYPTFIMMPDWLQTVTAIFRLVHKCINETTIFIHYIWYRIDYNVLK